MYNHFVEDTNYTGGLIVNPKFDYVSKLFRGDLDRIIKYVKDSALTVMNQHLLVRLLGTIDTLYTNDIKNYMLSVYREADGLERMYGIASGTNGNITSHNGLFYNQETTDVLLSAIEYFDFYDEDPDKLVPLRAYSHPFNAPTAAIANGKYRSPGKYCEDLSVTLIDIPRLAYMYWHWVNRNKNTTGTRLQNAATFVYRDVLSRMIPSILDVSYFNRICAKQYGDRLDDWIAYYPIAVNDFSERLDEMIDYYLNEVAQSTIIYDRVLTTIPALTVNNMGNVFKLPDININRNNAWLVLVSRVDIYLLVMSLAANQRNNSDLTAVKNKLRYIVNEISNNNGLNVKVPYITNMKINRLKFMLG